MYGKHSTFSLIALIAIFCSVIVLKAAAPDKAALMKRGGAVYNEYCKTY